MHAQKNTEVFLLELIVGVDEGSKQAELIMTIKGDEVRSIKMFAEYLKTNLRSGNF